MSRHPAQSTFRRGDRVRVSARTRVKGGVGTVGTVVYTWRGLLGRQWCVLEVAHNEELTVPPRELDLVPSAA